MKKIIIVLGIILTSGIAALALSQTKSNNNDVEIAQVKADRNALIQGNGPGSFKSNIATAD
jgi:hypothetical protein